MAKKDAEDLRKAMEGAGTDEATIIKIAANRDLFTRQDIAKAYKSLYGRDLVEDLKKELGGKFEDAMVALFTEPIEYDCQELKKAMKGAGTNEDTLIEIFASRGPSQMMLIKEKYKKLYNKELEADIKSETSGTLQHVLVSLLQAQRSINRNPNQAQCAKIAKEIFDAGEAKIGTDESVFNKYFTTLSSSELISVAQEYNKIAKHSILDAIEKEFSGSSKKAFKTIVYATISPSEYFATRIKDAIKGWGTNDNLLIRVLVTRDEVDMPRIKQYYKQLYEKDMVEDIKSDISGDYRTLLVELCSH